MREKIRCAVLGATGLVGQVFLWMLSEHPWFEPVLATGSDKRKGKRYGSEAKWLLPFPVPEKISELTIESTDSRIVDERDVKLVFSALPAKVAASVEAELREKGLWVFSNASAFRYAEDVPILIPEINLNSLEWIKKQGFPDKGFIVTNSNCTTSGLALTLAPLLELKIKKAVVSTYQSISGAGYPGLSALDIMGNTMPFIEKEEEKMIAELRKIVGLDSDIYTSCVRIPVTFGHLETVWLEFDSPVEDETVLNLWQNFGLNDKDLPSLPSQTIIYQTENNFPRPNLSFWGEPPGMQVFTGRLRSKKNMTGFVLLVNNIVRGAAGGSIVNAETFVKLYGDEIWKKL